jgi:hypothetical protein
MKIAGYVMVTGLAVLYVLLGYQAEPVTKTLAYVAATMLTLSLVVSIVKGR